jgi:hypothetical protein
MTLRRGPRGGRHGNAPALRLRERLDATEQEYERGGADEQCQAGDEERTKKHCVVPTI